ncbi:MAG: hypothetical protein E6R08_01485 [Nevskiaceae bacterium]|nr:MAG: hypothetical protein E6R08_01485 [Nevskiaceae bacterium]
MKMSVASCCRMIVSLWWLCVLSYAIPGLAQTLEVRYLRSDVEALYLPEKSDGPIGRALIVYYDGNYTSACGSDVLGRKDVGVDLSMPVGSAVFFKDCGEIVVLLRGKDVYRARDVWKFVASHEAFHALMQLQGSEIPLLWDEVSFESRSFVALNEEILRIFNDKSDDRQHCSLLSALVSADSGAFSTMARFISLEWPAEFYAYISLGRHYNDADIGGVYANVRGSIGSADRYSVGVKAGLLMDRIRVKYGLEHRAVSGWRWLKLFEKDCGGDAIGRIPVGTVRSAGFD